MQSEEPLYIKSTRLVWICTSMYNYAHCYDVLVLIKFTYPYCTVYKNKLGWTAKRVEATFRFISWFVCTYYSILWYFMYQLLLYFYFECMYEWIIFLILYVWMNCIYLYTSVFWSIGKVEELWIKMYEHNYIDLFDVQLVQAWLHSLLLIGYKFPSLR